MKRKDKGGRNHRTYNVFVISISTEWRAFSTQFEILNYLKLVQESLTHSRGMRLMYLRGDLIGGFTVITNSEWTVTMTTTTTRST